MSNKRKIMTNKRKIITMNPKRINSYNKFLATLDENSKNIDRNNKNIDENNNKTLDNEIKEAIEYIFGKYDSSNMSSPNFTGQTPNDILFFNYDHTNPNNYMVFSDDCCDVNKNPKCVKKKKEEQPILIRETINIEAEINNVSDIIKLTDRYQNDPAIKYNIDMSALHSIREPLEELNNMIGMSKLKNNIVDQILYFVQKLHKNKNLSGEFLHTVIYGPPGTGKTEIAKIMGKIYSKIGILSKGTFTKVTRSDLIAGYLGQTAIKTKDVIKDALGGVLFIDEAYALGNPEKRDSFAKECIDTLCEAASDNKDNLMIIIAGYEKELKESFFSFNQGLDSRFTWRFKTDDYSGEDLYKIFLKMVKDIGWEFDDNSGITVDWFKKNKDCFKFYGRDIESLLSKTKIAHSRRVFCRPESEKKRLIIKDLDKGFEIYLMNEDIKNKKEEEDRQRYLYSTLYS
jgi:SpoVK/Ycf46/Vps4 family AAA+-type ATPase